MGDDGGNDHPHLLRHVGFLFYLQPEQLLGLIRLRFGRYGWSYTNLPLVTSVLEGKNSSWSVTEDKDQMAHIFRNPNKNEARKATGRLHQRP